MKWAGYSQQQSNVDISTTNPVLFQTIPMVARLESSTGVGLPGGEATYYASGWKSLGTTDVNGNTPPLELLPGKYSFRMKYLGYSQQKSNIVVPATNPIVFATTPMTVELRNSDDVLIDQGVVTYYASGWKSFGTTSGGTVTMELLPGKYSFRMKYEGYSQQKSNVMVDGDSPLVYKTEKMEVQLVDSNGDPLDTGVVTYYASGWKTFGTTSGGTVAKELLPGKYSFRMKYEGYSQQQSNINILDTNPLIFQTIPMVVSLQTCDDVGLDGGDVTYYASGWKTFGTTDASGNATKQLLPGKYSFRMKYIGQSNQKSNVSIESTNPLIYNTTNVALSYSGTITYYASGWKTFTQPAMEMLPHNYPFRFDNKNQTNIDVTGCSVEKTVFATTVYDCNNKVQSGVDVKWYKYGNAGTKYSLGTTTNVPLLGFIDGDANYQIVVLAKYRNQQNSLKQNPTTNSYFDFNMVGAEVELLDYNGDQICLTDGVDQIKYYSWGSAASKYDMSIVGCFGEECVLPGDYGFVLTHNDTWLTKAPNTVNASSPDVTFQTCRVVDDGWGCVSYYQYGNAGNPTAWTGDIELMPVKVVFKNDVGATQTIVLSQGTTVYLNSAKNAIVESGFTYEIGKIYPNPFVEKTTFDFEINEDQKVLLGVFDLQGRLIKTLINQNLSKGKHKITWNSQDEYGGNVKQGIYIVKLVTANSVSQKTIVKMR